MSAVIRHGRAVCRPRKSSMMIWPPAARWAATSWSLRRHKATSCPASARSPAAANEPLPPPSTATRMLALLRVGSRRCLSRRPLLEPEMLHLAQGIARQAVDPKIGARNLVACELRQAKSFDLRHVGGRARARDHVGDGHLLPFAIRAADYGGFSDGGMLIEHAFDLGGINVL